MNDRQILAFGILAALAIFLLAEISFSLSKVKIIVAIPSDLGSVIEGEAREVPASSH